MMDWEKETTKSAKDAKKFSWLAFHPGGLSAREASAMIGVHRIGGGEKHPGFGRRRGLSRALGDYSGGHVLAKVLSSAVLGIDAYRVDLL